MNDEEWEKELRKEHYKALRSGDTNMGFDTWKITHEIINLRNDLRLK